MAEATVFMKARDSAFTERWPLKWQKEPFQPRRLERLFQDQTWQT